MDPRYKCTNIDSDGSETGGNDGYAGDVCGEGSVRITLLAADLPGILLQVLRSQRDFVYAVDDILGDASDASGAALEWASSARGARAGVAVCGCDLGDVRCGRQLQRSAASRQGSGNENLRLVAIRIDESG